MNHFNGKNVLLTGGSRGLGPHIARAFAERGANIAITARSEQQLTDVAEDLKQRNTKILALPSDITDEDARNILVNQVEKDLGPIDILVNNAGIELVYSYHLMGPDYIQKMIETNLAAPMLLIRRVLPGMIKRRNGHIVNMSSLGGKRGSPYSATYAATKAGLIEFTRGIRTEIENTGVRMSVICPGFVAESGMFAVYNKKPPWISGETTPEKVAAAVLRAIQDNIGEIIVNPGPAWIMPILDAIHPGITNFILKAGGVYNFYKKQAEENEIKP